MARKEVLIVELEDIREDVARMQEGKIKEKLILYFHGRLAALEMVRFKKCKKLGCVGSGQMPSTVH